MSLSSAFSTTFIMVSADKATNSHRMSTFNRTRFVCLLHRISNDPTNKILETSDDQNRYFAISAALVCRAV